MESSPNPGDRADGDDPIAPVDPIDAAADLDLLDRATSLVDVDVFLDFGPWWYAPLLATMIGGLTLFGRDVGDATNLAAGAIALVAAAVIATHDDRRRHVRLGRGSRRSVALLALIVLIVWALVAAWGTVISSVGIDRFVPGYAALAWTLTTLVLLAVRAGFHALRQRRRVLR